ncbi:MAG: cytochrome c [Bacteroidales bacterium]|nr:cytochrome c [Bacteroidales bacterium]
MKQIILMFAVVLLVAGAAGAQSKAWEVPAKYKTMKAPVNLKDASVIADGKEAWAKQCKACHGTMGLGDGPKGAMLKTDPGNFKDAKFQAQTDGELYYKTTFGNGEMPAYEKKVPSENDRWALVAYMRTMK